MLISLDNNSESSILIKIHVKYNLQIELFLESGGWVKQLWKCMGALQGDSHPYPWGELHHYKESMYLSESKFTNIIYVGHKE